MTQARGGMIYYTFVFIKMTECMHGFDVVAAHWQLANAEVDDDQRHSTLLLLGPLILGRLLEGRGDG